MENYRRVRQPRTDLPPIAPDELLVTAISNPVEVAGKGVSMLEEEHPAITLKAMGQAIGKAVSVAEILKRRVAGLHQLVATSTVALTDVWEPTVEGLERIETTRYASAIEITLSKTELDTSKPGYQAPLSESDVLSSPEGLAALEASLVTEHRPSRGPGQPRSRSGRGRGRGRDRGGRGPSEDAADDGLAHGAPEPDANGQAPHPRPRGPRSGRLRGLRPQGGAGQPRTSDAEPTVTEEA
ncbi:RPP25 [Auxenochlorella protothecoides x Auxenochlorella symbiontica]